MRVSFTHGSERARVREQMESAIPKLLAEAGGRAEAVEYAWEGTRSVSPSGPWAAR